MKSKEEKKKQRCATKIQNAFRCYNARRTARDKYRSRYVQYYDEYNGQYMYKNKVTQETTSRKPKCFLDDDDLAPLPNTLESPLNYNSGTEDTSLGFLLFVTVHDFPLGKWPTIDEAVNADHELLVNSFTHDYICKFRQENVIILKDPTTMEFTEAMVALRRIVMKRGFLVVYIATHVITVTKGEKSNKKENCYFAFRNSIWDTPAETAESCISLTTVSQLMNRVQSRQKTVLLNCSHVPPPRATLFPNPKIMYPPDSFLTRLSTLCKCVVVAACSSGTRVRDVLKQSPSTLPALVMPTLSAPPLVPTKKVRESPSEYKLETSHVAATTQPADVDIFDKQAALCTLMRDWDLSPPNPIEHTPRPVKPGAVWKRNERANMAIQVDLPETAQRKNYSRRLLYWKLKTGLAVPVNMTRRGLRSYNRYIQRAPCQTSLVDDGRTLFGKALFNGLSGGAHSADSEVVTVGALFKFLHESVKSDVARLKATAMATLPENNVDESLVAAINATNQSPMIIIPPGHSSLYLSNPVCFRCGPAAPPEKPYVVRVGNNEVLLEWYNPPFSGVAPTKYKVYMRNKSRNFNQWKEVYCPGDIVKTQFLVRDLPMGVSCQFKVSAFNSGGWGLLSEETIFVTPGEENEQLSVEAKWRRIKEGGVLAALDHMTGLPLDSNQQLRGLTLLQYHGQINIGYKNSVIAIKVAAVAIQCIKTFDRDPSMLALSFHVLGWCLQGKPERKTRMYCIENDIVGLAKKATEDFRTDSKVMNALSWLRKSMSKYISMPAVIERHHTLNPQPKQKMSFEEEEEDEFEYFLDENEEDGNEMEIIQR